MLDILIKNAKIVDGTGSPWFCGEIGILGEDIVTIKRRIDTDAARTLDAKGLIASPGFTDMHTHSDLRVLRRPDEEYKIKQGITTSLLGQDGLSVAPVSNGSVMAMKKRVAGLDGTYVSDWTWRTVDQYLTELERVKPATNNLMLVPHGNVRAMVVGWDARPATDEETSRMGEIVDLCMQQGACGLSSGLILPPCPYADRRELIGILKATAKNQGFFVVHIRNESDRLLEALEEVIDACREAECPLHVSHFKVAGKRNWGKSVEALDLVDKARESGVEITFDQYPYVAGCTMLDAVIPPKFHEGGIQRLLERLKDPAVRNDIRKAQEGGSGEWDNYVDSCGWDGIIITAVESEKNKSVEGRNVSELAREAGKQPIDVIADLLIEEDNAVTMALFYGDEKDVERIMKHPCGMACTDGIMGGKPHPRVYGSFPRILGRYVRERKVLSLEQAVQRMTGRPAGRLNLQNRGLLREGMKADITVFNAETVADLGTFADPNQYPAGIAHVIVNGKVALEGGELTGARAGKALRSH